MCESCYSPLGATCMCNPCLVLQGSNFCTVCFHDGSGPGVPAETDASYADAAPSSEGAGADDSAAEFA